MQKMNVINHQTIGTMIANQKKSLFTQYTKTDDESNENFSDDESVISLNINESNISSEDIEDDITKLIPSVLANLKEADKLETFEKFLKLVSEDEFPLENIAFLLFLDVVNWFSQANSSQMKYSFPQTLQFWRIGQKLFHGRFLRFMSGPKNQGQILQGATYKGQYDPQESEINFAVPSNQVLRKLNPFEKEDLQPGIFHTTIDAIAQQDNGNSFKIAVDAKKISKGRGKIMGDIDLFGFETAKLSDKKEQLEMDLQIVKDVISFLDGSNTQCINYLDDTSKRDFGEKSKKVIQMISLRLKSLREVKLSLQRSVTKFLNMAEKDGKDWRKSNLLNAISSLKTSLYDVNSCIKKLQDTVNQVGYYIATVNMKQKHYKIEQKVDLTAQGNYYELKDDGTNNTDSETRFIKQRTKKWHSIRETAKVSGSTINSALCQDTLKKQQEHFDSVIHKKSKPEASDTQKKNMAFGTENEINVIATLTCKILPIFFPNLNYVEEGCYKLQYNGQDFMVVSPDGSLRRSPSADASLGFEAKCRTSNPNALPVYYSIPPYYILQIMSEMKVLDVQSLICICWSPESSVCFKVNFDEDLWNKSWSTLTQIYGQESPKRPLKKSQDVHDIKELISKTLARSVEILGEFPSCTVQKTMSKSSLENDKNTDSHHKEPSDNSVTLEKKVTIEEVQTTLHDLLKYLNDQYQLCRTLANEILVFVIADLDRVFSFEQKNAHIIAYGMKGASLFTETYRQMLNHVISHCIRSGLHLPLISSDSAFQRIAVRSVDNKPLTIPQLQKDVWKDVNKMQKSTIIAKLHKLNTYNDVDYRKIEVVDEISGKVCKLILEKKDSNVHLKAYLSSNTFKMIQRHVRGEIEVNEDTENDQPETMQENGSMDGIMNFIPDEILEEIGDETLEMAESLLKEDVSSGIFPDVDAFDIEDMFENVVGEFPLLDEDSSDMDIISDLESIQITQSADIIPSTISDNATSSTNLKETFFHFKLEQAHYNLMKTNLESDERVKNPERWSNISQEQFLYIFSEKKHIEKNFLRIELRVCLEAITYLLKEQKISYGLSWNKFQLVELFDGLYKGKLDNNIKYKRKNKKKLTLKDLCIRSLCTLPKQILSSIYAENIWTNRKQVWEENNMFKNGTTIHGLNRTVDWYSCPDIITVDEKEHAQFYVIDAHHKLCSLRTKVCSSGLPTLGIQKQAWVEAAKSDNTKLSLALVTDLIDKQNNAFALRTFDEDVEIFMRENGFEKEANFTKLVREWYKAEDEPGINAIERTQFRLNFLDWLKDAGRNQMNQFPPPGKYISDMPWVLWEGLIITIERKLQLYPYCTHGSYNSRATGTLEVENIFQSFQELDPAGKGILKPDDIPAALGTALELDNYRLNPNRPFSMRTTASSVYPIHPLDIEEQMEIDSFWAPPAHRSVDVIQPRDHFIFDIEDRKKLNPRRKKGDVRAPHQPARGESGVRQHHRRDESLILSHLRYGLSEIPDIQ